MSVPGLGHLVMQLPTSHANWGIILVWVLHLDSTTFPITETFCYRCNAKKEKEKKRLFKKKTITKIMLES